MGAGMSAWAKKRFWTEASVRPEGNGFAVQLDGRPVKTPAKAPLIVPTRALAEKIAAEWHAQDDKIQPDTMPATRTANSAIDKVSAEFDAVADLVAAYGETDLLCYRADAPQALRARQDAAWDPLLDWAAARYGLRFVVVTGVMPHPQPPETVAALAQRVARLSAFELTAFHDLVAMTGSLVIGLAVIDGQDVPERLWQTSRIDEDWQTEQWGEDDEARALALLRRKSFLDAAAFLAALR
ncbi:MAG: Chaperone required for the assembly of the mitochondrial F1-ATPase [Rhodobacteraceae bacterium HLUCCA12]|nr:MAG: Chaperone required for the assembly of the mitochondrial F1-ATPase [Rhodobacteraceae bacterium HLUCCA12]